MPTSPERRKALFNGDDSADDSDASGQPGGILLTGNNETLGDGSLQVNEDFARKYEAKKRKEELSRRKTALSSLTLWIADCK